MTLLTSLGVIRGSTWNEPLPSALQTIAASCTQLAILQLGDRYQDLSCLTPLPLQSLDIHACRDLSSISSLGLCSRLRTLNIPRAPSAFLVRREIELLQLLACLSLTTLALPSIDHVSISHLVQHQQSSLTSLAINDCYGGISTLRTLSALTSLVSLHVDFNAVRSLLTALRSRGQVDLVVNQDE